jgi:hypothetical protein
MKVRYLTPLNIKNRLEALMNISLTIMWIPESEIYRITSKHSINIREEQWRFNYDETVENILEFFTLMRRW